MVLYRLIHLVLHLRFSVFFLLLNKDNLRFSVIKLFYCWASMKKFRVLQIRHRQFVIEFIKILKSYFNILIVLFLLTWRGVYYVYSLPVTVVTENVSTPRERTRSKNLRLPGGRVTKCKILQHKIAVCAEKPYTYTLYMQEENER